MFVHGKIGLKCISQPTFRNSPALQRTLRGPGWDLKFFEIWNLVFTNLFFGYFRYLTSDKRGILSFLQIGDSSKRLHHNAGSLILIWITLKTSEANSKLADKTEMSKPQEYNLHNNLKVIFSWPLRSSKYFKALSNTLFGKLFQFHELITGLLIS